jgi:hypothetical protein
MGNATQVTDLIRRAPLSNAEIEERDEAARIREDVTTTLDGEVVERVSPRVAPISVQRPEPSTWD